MTDEQIEKDPRALEAHQWKDARFAELMLLYINKTNGGHDRQLDSYMNMKEQQIRNISIMYTNYETDSLPDSINDIPDQHTLEL